MIDLHCHLLPGIDDGAQTLSESLELARFAVDNGIQKMVMTPHIHHGRWDNTQTSIEQAFNQLRDALLEQQIELIIERAAEVRIAPEMMQMVQRHQLPFVGQWQETKVVLLELPHSHIPPGTDKLIQWLMQHQITPLIAHPERNKEIMRDFNKVRPLVQLGCLFQITSASMSGHFGTAAHQVATQMLEAGWVTVLATDAHNMRARPPDLNSGYEAAAAIIGAAAARELVYDRPAKMTEHIFQHAA